MTVVIMLRQEPVIQLEALAVAALEQPQQTLPQAVLVMMASLMVATVFKMILPELFFLGVAVAVAQPTILDMLVMADSAAAAAGQHKLAVELVRAVRAV